MFGACAVFIGRDSCRIKSPPSPNPPQSPLEPPQTPAGTISRSRVAPPGAPAVYHHAPTRTRKQNAPTGVFCKRFVGRIVRALEPYSKRVFSGAGAIGGGNGAGMGPDAPPIQLAPPRSSRSPLLGGTVCRARHAPPLQGAGGRGGRAVSVLPGAGGRPGGCHIARNWEPGGRVLSSPEGSDTR